MIRVTVTKTYGDDFIRDDEYRELGDGAREVVIELVRDDMCEFFDNADWKIECVQASEDNPP